MLKVKTKLGISNIHGIGLFADEFIPKGAMIFVEDEFTKILTVDEYEKLEPIQKNFFKRYSYYKNDVYKCSLDNDRFMNHSDTPNTFDINEYTFAMYDINIGDEITCNYDDICDDNWWESEENID